MRRSTRFAVLTLGAWFSLGSTRVVAQAMLADDILILSKGQREQEKARTESHLGPVHGNLERPFSFLPGSDESRLGERFGFERPSFLSATQNRDILSAASEGPVVSGERPGRAATASAPEPTGARAPLYGALEVPGGFDEGPHDGLTLDMAIEQIARTSSDLATKFQEIPKARADVITAGLRGNPLLFASADNVPYGRYSERRPGDNSYGVTLVQPLDLNRKYLRRVAVACRAQQVIEAQYQDAVRLAIDRLSAAFVDVLDAREAVRYSRVGLAGLDRVISTTREQVEKGVQPAVELESLLIQRDTAETTLEEADLALRRATRSLSVLLALGSEAAATLEVRGSIQDSGPAPPPVEELVRLALSNRPDLAAYRLGVRSAEANVRLQEAERFPDVFLLYTPYGFRNNAWVDRDSATSWGVGALVSIPIRNRNQGNIRRAEHTVVQTRIELSGQERQVIAEVEQSAADYAATLGVVQRLELRTLPRARRLRDDRFRLYTEGQESLITYLNAQRDYNDVVRLYREAMIRHRRVMLHLNTVVGQRILP